MTRRITAKVARIDLHIGNRLNGQCDLQAGETARHFSRAMRLGKTTGFGVPREAQARPIKKLVFVCRVSDSARPLPWPSETFAVTLRDLCRDSARVVP